MDVNRLLVMIDIYNGLRRILKWIGSDEYTWIGEDILGNITVATMVRRILEECQKDAKGTIKKYFENRRKSSEEAVDTARGIICDGVMDEEDHTPHVLEQATMTIILGGPETKGVFRSLAALIKYLWTDGNISKEDRDTIVEDMLGYCECNVEDLVCDSGEIDAKVNDLADEQHQLLMAFAHAA